MAAGGGGGTLWIKMLALGLALLAGAAGLHHGHVGPTWLYATLLALGGLAVVFASCEAMIKCVEGIGERLDWNQFVAGTMAGLASNVPELVMLGFVVAAKPRVGFIVVTFTLHVGAMAFGVYSGLLPRDASGYASLPEPLVKLSTDLYACATAAFLSTGLLMVSMRAFGVGGEVGPELTATDLYVIGAGLLLVQVVATTRLVSRFSADDDVDARPVEDVDGDGDVEASDAGAPSVASIAGYGALGVVTSVIGGHAVGDFADILVTALTEAGYSEMLGALILSVFACAGAYAMIATAHVKGMYDIALANVSGAVNQVPFVVLPVCLILIAAFAQTGVTPPLPGGGALPVDLETTAVVLLGAPPVLLLWKAVQDDGKVNWVETATMVFIFSLTLYFLAQHG